MTAPEVKSERSGWRDLSLNDRHRLWGWDCPACDLDFYEYDNGKTVALVEYKHETAPAVKVPYDSKLVALIDLANRANVPAFGARYAANFSWWAVAPLNRRARTWLGAYRRMSEREWVGLLYRIRGRPVPLSVLKAIGERPGERPC